MTTKRRTAAAITWSLLMVGGLAGCGQEGSTSATSGSDGSMMQRHAQTPSDVQGLNTLQGRQLRGQLKTWCQDLMSDRAWHGLDTGERAEIMRTMHRRMRSHSDDQSLPMMSPEWMPSPSMMTRGCRTAQ
jgi:hypothetical protein